MIEHDHHDRAKNLSAWQQQTAQPACVPPPAGPPPPAAQPRAPRPQRSNPLGPKDQIQLLLAGEEDEAEEAIFA